MAVLELTSHTKLASLNKDSFAIKAQANLTLWADAFYKSKCPYGLKCLGKIMAYLMSFFLHLCDCSVPYCADFTQKSAQKSEFTKKIVLKKEICSKKLKKL